MVHLLPVLDEHDVLFVTGVLERAGVFVEVLAN